MTRQSTDTGLRIAARAPQVMLMALLCMLLAREASAGTCSASAFSCPASGTCIITGTWNIGSDCVLDFGTKAVELKGTFQAETQTGAFEVRAANLTLNGGKLKSLGDTLAPGGAISVVLTGQFLAKGSGPRIDTSGNSGGPIRISAATIDLQTGTIVADGGTTEDCGDGGIITLEAFAGLLSAGGSVKTTSGGGYCIGGEVALTGARVEVAGDIDAHGNGGASDQAIVVTATETDVVVSGSSVLNANGVGQPDGYGSDGGGVVLYAPLGNVVASGSSITAWGKSPYGSGGSLVVAAGQNATIDTRVTIQGGSNGIGGELDAESGGSMTISDDILATGGTLAPYGGGGSVVVLSEGPILVTSIIDASALAGGDITVDSASTTTISGTLNTHGSRWVGGSVDVTGCSVSVTGTLDAAASNGGIGGYVDLEAGAISIGATGRLLAADCGFDDCVALSTAGAPPTIHPNAVISPTPALFVEPEFPTCGS